MCAESCTLDLRQCNKPTCLLPEHAFASRSGCGRAGRAALPTSTHPSACTQTPGMPPGPPLSVAGSPPPQRLRHPSAAVCPPRLCSAASSAAAAILGYWAALAGTQDGWTSPGAHALPRLTETPPALPPGVLTALTARHGEGGRPTRQRKLCAHGLEPGGTRQTNLGMPCTKPFSTPEERKCAVARRREKGRDERARAPRSLGG